MKTTLPSKYQALQKVIACYDSCKLTQQLNAADHLARNFNDMFYDRPISRLLIDKSFNKLQEIMESHNREFYKKEGTP